MAAVDVTATERSGEAHSSAGKSAVNRLAASAR